MLYDENTRLTRILEEHPWLEQELPRRYPELKAMDSPAARFMLKRMTVKDASRLSGIPAAKLLEELEQLIEKVQRENG
jgi:hypothetical protein